MSRFLQRLALFVGLATVLFGSGEWLARRMYRSDSDLGFKAQAFDASPCQYRTIVIGSSWAEQAVIPSLLKGGGFNLGYPLQDVYYSSQLLRRAVLPRCSSLNRAIIFLGYPSFTWDLLADSHDNFFTHEYSRCFNIPVSGGWRKALQNYNYVKHLSLLYETRQRFLYDLFGPKRPQPFSVSQDTFAIPPRWTEGTILGDGYRFSGRAIPPADLDRNARVEVQLRYAGWQPARVAASIQLLADTIDGLSARGIKVVLVLPPFTAAYRQHIPEEYLDGFRRSMAEVMNRCKGDAVEYRDYSASASFTPDMFRDSDHLNYKGAMVLTRMLDEPGEEQKNYPDGTEPDAPGKRHLAQQMSPQP